MRLRSIFFLLAAGMLLTACGSYRQNILFQVDEAKTPHALPDSPGNYIIQKNDLLTLEVFTNHGEKIVDPNRESFKDANVQTIGSTSVQYVVKADGTADFPLIQPVSIVGLTLEQAEEVLEKSYEQFYEGGSAEAYWMLLSTCERTPGHSEKFTRVISIPGGRIC